LSPLVSILIPAYNADEWIADTIRSAVAQTWQNKEIIIVDDGSTDHTLEVAQRFESESVRVVRQENQGAAAARNRALSLSTGHYIQWLDADDLLAPDKIAQQMGAGEAGETQKTLLSCSWGRFMYRPRRAQFIPTALWCDLSPAEFLLRKMGQNIFMQTATWLASRELTEAAGPWDTSLLSDDDGEYFSRLLLASNGVRFVRNAKAYYRSVGNMRLSYVGRSDRKLEAMWRSMQLHVRYLRSLEDSERVRAACVKYLQDSVIRYHPLRRDILEQMYEAARDLGGQLEAPLLSWKYSWIKTLFGWDLAQRALLTLPSVKWSAVRIWDRTFFRLESRVFQRNKSGV
jgi:glycosyltransferase involved in cell wall biosynthesis